MLRPDDEEQLALLVHLDDLSIIAGTAMRATRTKVLEIGMKVVPGNGRWGRGPRVWMEARAGALSKLMQNLEVMRHRSNEHRTLCSDLRYYIVIALGRS